MSFRVTKPRVFVASWLRFHKMNIIAVKQLFYAHKQARERALKLFRKEWAR